MRIAKGIQFTGKKGRSYAKLLIWGVTNSLRWTVIFGNVNWEIDWGFDSLIDMQWKIVHCRTVAQELFSNQHFNQHFSICTSINHHYNSSDQFCMSYKMSKIKVQIPEKNTLMLAEHMCMHVMCLHVCNYPTCSCHSCMAKCMCLLFSGLLYACYVHEKHPKSMHVIWNIHVR